MRFEHDGPEEVLGDGDHQDEHGDGDHHITGHVISHNMIACDDVPVILFFHVFYMVDMIVVIE